MMKNNTGDGMNVAQIRKLDVANGPGIRVSLFVSGCYFNCYNCFNKEYQNFKHGQPYDEQIRDEIIKELKKPYTRGLSILGGEPMEHATTLRELILDIRPHMRPGQDIWIWSGYTWEQIQKDPDKLFLSLQCDILVDGLFENDKKDLSLQFRGSTNQRIIDINKSVMNDKIIYWNGLTDQ